MDRCALCQKELVPFSYREAYQGGFICGPCAEKQKANKAGPAPTPAPVKAPAAPAAAPAPVKAPPAPAPAPAAKKPEGRGESAEDDLSSALDSLLN